MRKIDVAAILLAVVGALNWGLVAVFEFDLVAGVFGLEFGETSAITRIVYGLVGLAGVWTLVRIPAFAESRRRERVFA